MLDYNHTVPGVSRTYMTCNESTGIPANQDNRFVGEVTVNLDKKGWRMSQTIYWHLLMTSESKYLTQQLPFLTIWFCAPTSFRPEIETLIFIYFACFGTQDPSENK